MRELWRICACRPRYLRPARCDPRPRRRALGGSCRRPAGCRALQALLGSGGWRAAQVSTPQPGVTPTRAYVSAYLISRRRRGGARPGNPLGPACLPHMALLFVDHSSRPCLLPPPACPPHTQADRDGVALTRRRPRSPAPGSFPLLRALIERLIRDREEEGCPPLDSKALPPAAPRRDAGGDRMTRRPARRGPEDPRASAAAAARRAHVFSSNPRARATTPRGSRDTGAAPYVHVASAHAGFTWTCTPTLSSSTPRIIAFLLLVPRHQPSNPGPHPVEDTWRRSAAGDLRRAGAAGGEPGQKSAGIRAAMCRASWTGPAGVDRPEAGGHHTVGQVIDTVRAWPRGAGRRDAGDHPARPGRGALGGGAGASRGSGGTPPVVP
jgi:hypothetical protein